MTDIKMADISEFQANIDAPTYLKNHRSIICRVHNGTRPDNMMPTRMNYLRSYPFTAIGWYQYFSSTHDPAEQARGFIAVVGKLRTNEFPILDVEEGDGSQIARAQAWFDVVDPWANLTSTLYSGLSFLTDKLGGTKQWPTHPIWVAAYGQREPTVPHVLWQYSDREQYNAIKPPLCDSSIHHGTDKDFIYAVRHGKSRPHT
jgi:lysozyme